MMPVRCATLGVDAVAWLRGPTAPESPRYLLSEVLSVRRQSTAFFLGDVSFLSDPKFRALAKRLPDDNDFNSAVGAYFICLAAARRNGRPTLNSLTETGSDFIADLQAVGLLNGEGFYESAFRDWAPTAPQIVAGTRRAASAERDDAGRFTSAVQPAGVAGVTVQPSPPLTSNPFPSTEEIESEKEEPLPDFVGPLEPDCLDTYYRLTLRFPRGKVKGWLEELAASYGHDKVSKALAVAMTEDQDVSTLLSRTQNVLAAAEHERVRLGEIARRRRDAKELARADSMSEEQKAANLAKLREAMETKGLLPRHGDDH